MPSSRPTLQSRLEAADHGLGSGSTTAGPTITDPVGFFRGLEASRRFHRDTGFGRIFHPGTVSLRENVRTNSLHVLIRHDRIAAHVDRVSPLGLHPEGPSRYSLHRAAVHNAAGMAQDLLLLLRGRHGDHRCELDCEWAQGQSEGTLVQSDLLDPRVPASSIQLEARVSGRLDEVRLRWALAAVVRHEGNYRDPLEVVDCPDDAALDAARTKLQSQHVLVTEHPPMRAWLALHPGGDVLMLNLDHAACDGFDALRVLRTIARVYTGGTDSDPPLDFLVGRDVPVRPASAPPSPWLGRYRALSERVRDFLVRPARLAPDQARDEPGYGFHLVSLSAEDTRNVVTADHQGTSRNVLMASLHLAIGEWNLQHGVPGGRIGVLVPVNLRPPEWRDPPVGNFSVTARVLTSPRHGAGPVAALRAVTAKTARNKRTRTGIALLAALKRSGLLPLWAKQSVVVLRPLVRNRRVDTALFANLGWLDEPLSFGADAGETTDMWFSVPARAPLGLCIGAVTVAARLHLTFRYPHRLFSDEAARRFADFYLAQVRLVATNRS